MNLWYHEITCLPDEEISTGFLLGRLMTTLHYLFVEISDGHRNPIGISFPKYSDPNTGKRSSKELPIGDRVRLFAQNESLFGEICLTERLQHLNDYIHVKSIRPVAIDSASWASYRRVHSPSSIESLVRRRMKRKGCTEVEAREHFVGYQAEYSRLPYLDMFSSSTQNRFRLSIERVKRSGPSEWSFSLYGLSRTSCVPEFN